jgi:protoporphyrinogen oxidase
MPKKRILELTNNITNAIKELEDVVSSTKKPKKTTNIGKKVMDICVKIREKTNLTPDENERLENFVMLTIKNVAEEKPVEIVERGNWNFVRIPEGSLMYSPDYTEHRVSIVQLETFKQSNKPIQN